MAVHAYHADRDLDQWEDDCLWVPIFDPQQCLVCRVIVATKDGTVGGSADRTAEGDRLLGEQRLAKILAALNT